MNKIYKVVWSKLKSCYVVTSEFGKSRTKSSGSGKRAGKAAVAAVALTAFLSCTGLAGAVSNKTVGSDGTLPSGTEVVVGNASELLTKTDANTTYLTKVDANTTYLTKVDANTTYLTKVDANTTYATKTDLLKEETDRKAADTALEGKIGKVEDKTANISYNAGGGTNVDGVNIKNGDMSGVKKINDITVNNNALGNISTLETTGDVKVGGDLTVKGKFMPDEVLIKDDHNNLTDIKAGSIESKNANFTGDIHNNTIEGSKLNFDTNGFGVSAVGMGITGGNGAEMKLQKDKISQEVLDADGNSNSEVNTSTKSTHTVTSGTAKTTVEQTAADINLTAEDGNINNKAKNITNTTTEDMTNTIGKDLTTIVGGNQSTAVGGDQSTDVTGNQSNTVSGHQSNTVIGNLTESVAGDVTEDYKANQTTKVGGDRTEIVTGDVVEYYKKDQTTTVDGNQGTDVKGDQTNTVGGKLTETVTGDVVENYKANQTTTVDKNQTTKVGGNQDIDVKGDQTNTVGGKLTETVTGDVTENYKANQTTTVDKNQTTHVKGNQTNTVDGTLTETVTGDVTEDYKANQTTKVGGNQSTDVKGDQINTVGGKLTETVTGDVEENYKANQMTTVDKNQTTKVGGDQDIDVKGDQTNTVGGKLTETVTGDVVEDYKGDQTTTIGGNQATDVAGSQSTTVGGDRITDVKGDDVLTAENITHTAKTQLINKVGTTSMTMTVTNTTFNNDVVMNNNLDVAGDVKAASYKIGSKTYIDNDGINANEQKIINVADGTLSDTSLDAVNGSQLFRTNQRIERWNRDLSRVGAGAAALAGLHPVDYDATSKLSFAVGFGSYKSEHAAAIGAFYRPNDNILFGVSSTVGYGDNMYNASLSFKFGEGSHERGISKTAQRKIDTLQNKVSLLEARLDNILNIFNPNAYKDFPDIPENHWAYEAVSTLAGNGIVEGYPDGDYHGDRTMTRYEMAMIIYNALKRGVQADMKLVREFQPELSMIEANTR